jgi:hypothetical protein
MAPDGSKKRSGRRAVFVVGAVLLLVLLAFTWAIRERIFEAWYIIRLDSRVPLVRVAASYRLASLGTRISLPGLGRRYVAQKLEEAKTKSPVKLSFGGYAETESWFHWVTFWNIAYRDPRASLPAILEFLDDEDEEIRLFGAEALGLVGTDIREAIPALRKAANDHDPRVRMTAECVMSKFTGEAAAK